MQVKDKGAPDTINVIDVLESCWIVMALLVAVNGPSDAGVEGTCKGTPELGSGLGKVRLIAKLGMASVPGVAPLASS